MPCVWLAEDVLAPHPLCWLCSWCWSWAADAFRLKAPNRQCAAHCTLAALLVPEEIPLAVKAAVEREPAEEAAEPGAKAKKKYYYEPTPEKLRAKREYQRRRYHSDPEYRERKRAQCAEYGRERRAQRAEAAALGSAGLP